MALADRMERIGVRAETRSPVAAGTRS